MRIFDADPAGLHALDTPGSGAEQEDVTRMALDREILVERADERIFGFGDYLILGGFRDRAAVGDGDETRAAAALDQAVDLVPMEHRATAATHGGDTLG